jgi:hypothetical protein
LNLRRRSARAPGSFTLKDGCRGACNFTLRSRRARDLCKQHAVTPWQVHLKKPTQTSRKSLIEVQLGVAE